MDDRKHPELAFDLHRRHPRGSRDEFLNLGSRMGLSMVSRSCERMDVLRFDGWQCKIRRQVKRETESWVLGLLMAGDRSYKSIRAS